MAGQVSPGGMRKATVAPQLEQYFMIADVRFSAILARFRPRAAGAAKESGWRAVQRASGQHCFGMGHSDDSEEGMPQPIDMKRYAQLKAAGDLPSPRGVALAIIRLTQSPAMCRSPSSDA
jgi:hypothetical protein